MCAVNTPSARKPITSTALAVMLKSAGSKNSLLRLVPSHIKLVRFVVVRSDLGLNGTGPSPSFPCLRGLADGNGRATCRE